MKNKNIIFDTFLTFTLLIIMAIIISSPKLFTQGTIDGLKLFTFNVLPGLFPFMLLTKIITEIGTIFSFSKKLDKISYKVFRTPGISLYAFAMSILSGYPIGAKIISDLYEKKYIDEKDAKIMSVFCTTSGPIFVIGTVGEMMFGNIKIGIIIYISHILSSIILGIIFSRIIRNKLKLNNFNKDLRFLKNENIIQKSISDTINSIFIVGAYITIFYLINELLGYIKITEIFSNLILKLDFFNTLSKSQSTALFHGIVEVTRGVKELSQTISPTTISIATGLISFSGISIIFQSLSFLNKAKIKTRFFVLSKSVHLILSILICNLLLIIF